MLRIPCENDGRLLYDKQFLKLPLKTKQTKRKEKHFQECTHVFQEIWNLNRLGNEQQSRGSSSIYGSFGLTLLDPKFMAFPFCYMTHLPLFKI